MIHALAHTFVLATLVSLLLLLSACESNDDRLAAFQQPSKTAPASPNQHNIELLESVNAHEDGVLLVEYGGEKYIFKRLEDMRFSLINKNKTLFANHIEWKMSVPRGHSVANSTYLSRKNSAYLAIVDVTLRKIHKDGLIASDMKENFANKVASGELVPIDDKLIDVDVQLYTSTRKFPRYHQTYYLEISKSLIPNIGTRHLLLTCFYHDKKKKSGYCEGHMTHRANQVSFRFSVNSLPMWKNIALTIYQSIEDAALKSAPNRKLIQ